MRQNRRKTPQNLEKLGKYVYAFTVWSIYKIDGASILGRFKYLKGILKIPLHQRKKIKFFLKNK